METLTIQVNCRLHRRDGPPQLGITVEAPYSLQLRQQQAAAKDYRDHDYQNCYLSETGGLTTNRQNSSSNNNNNNNNNNTRNNNLINGTNIKQSLANQLGEPIQRGLQITQIQPNSVIDKNGQFRVGDIIVEVNDVNLQMCTFQDAQKTLREFVVKSSHEPLILKVLRKAASSSSLPSTTGSQATVIERGNELSVSSSINSSPKDSILNANSLPQSNNGVRHLVGALNTRRIGTKHKIRLAKSKESGFGIKIAERDNMFGANRPIYITAITTTGSAYKDGRLKEGDMLLEVNGIDLTGKSQPEVTKMLKSVGVDEYVDFVVSRLENPGKEGYHELNECINQTDSSNRSEKDQSLIDLGEPGQDDSVFHETHDNQFEMKIDRILMDGPGTYMYDIPLNDTKSAGLGLYLKYPTSNGKDLGIWIEKVITGGAAWKDGRLLPNDQILAINGINLVGLSNAAASETLTATVCRGIGPEATANTIRLNIHRRDPSIVAKILHGTNNRIEHSDLPINMHNKTFVEAKNNNTQDSFITAFDATLHSRSQSSNDTNCSNKSSNHNSQNDSAMSPQTQASNSLISTNLGNDKSDQNNSDKTNDTSSAISQITDFTSVPNTDYNTSDREQINSDNQATSTLPKTLDSSSALQNIEPASSTQSWDDESIDNTTSGEDRFQRDGFGRQSISEKRHAQLMAQNTDTYKRNKKQRDEQERLQQLEDQFRQQCLDNQRHSMQQQRIPDPNMHNFGSSIYRQHTNTIDDFSKDTHREVPVDVQLPVEPGIEQAPINSNETSSKRLFQINQGETRIPSHIALQQNGSVQQVMRCWKCGSSGQCYCSSFASNQRNQFIDRYENQTLKKSNSLESIQPYHEPLANGLIVPRAGTVRVARNRKINESFRAAVDRSYEASMMNDSSAYNYPLYERQRSDTSKITSSIANSTNSTSNDERYLLNNSNGVHNIEKKDETAGHKKSSSLLTRFLKFGSMKKSRKKNKDSIANPKPLDNRSNQDNNSDFDSNRSNISRSTHSRTQSTQSHPNTNGNQMRHQQTSNGQLKANQLYGTNMKPMTQPNVELHNQHRASINMYQQRLPPSLHNQNHIAHQVPPGHSKLPTNYIMRPTNMMNNHQQYSHPHHQLGHLANSLPPQIQHYPIDLRNHHPIQFQPTTAARNHMMHNPLMSLQNGCQQWQSPPAVHGPNGLWVANSPATDIYGTHLPQQASMMQRSQQQPPLLTSHQAPPFVPHINAQGMNGHLLHQPPILQGHGSAITQQHMHNQRPEHICYYDF